MSYKFKNPHWVALTFIFIFWLQICIAAPEKKLLNSYLDYLAHLNILNFNKKQQYAYWINLYNALTGK